MKLALILAVAMYNSAAVQGSRLCVTLYALSLGAPSWVAGALVALYYVLPIVVGLSIGRWIDRVGSGPVLAVCGLASLASFVLPAVLPNFAMLTLSVALAGFAFVATSVAANVMVPQMGTRDEHAANLSWYALGSSAGMSLGPLIAGFGIDHAGHRATFAILATVPLAMLLILYAGRKRLPGTVPRTAASQGRLGDLMRAPGVPVPLLGSALAPVVLDLFFFVVPLHGTVLGLSASAIGIVLGVSAGASMFVRVVLPWIARRVRDWSLVASSFAGTGLALVLVPLATDTPVLLLLAVMAGISTGISAPMVLVVLYNCLPAGRQGEILGVRAVMLSVGQMAAPSLVGMLGGVLGLLPVMLFLGGGVMGYGWLARREGRARRPE